MRELDLPWINILQLDLLETTHSTHILTNTQTRNGIKKKLTTFLRCFSNTRKNCFWQNAKKLFQNQKNTHEQNKSQTITIKPQIKILTYLSAAITHWV